MNWKINFLKVCVHGLGYGMVIEVLAVQVWRLESRQQRKRQEGSYASVTSALGHRHRLGRHWLGSLAEMASSRCSKRPHLKIEGRLIVINPWLPYMGRHNTHTHTHAHTKARVVESAQFCISFWRSATVFCMVTTISHSCQSHTRTPGSSYLCQYFLLPVFVLIILNLVYVSDISLWFWFASLVISNMAHFSETFWQLVYAFREMFTKPFVFVCVCYWWSNSGPCICKGIAFPLTPAQAHLKSDNELLHCGSSLFIPDNGSESDRFSKCVLL